MKKQTIIAGTLSALIAFSACNNEPKPTTEPETEQTETAENPMDIYVPVKLTTDMTKLSESEKQVIPLLIEAAKHMDEIFWLQAYGNKEELLNSIEDENLKAFANVNYGPWDRLDGNKPFIDGVGEKPLGAQYYPLDMTKEEFEAADLENKKSLYTLIKRDDAGNLTTVWFHEAYAEHVNAAAELLEKAAAITEDEIFANYLTLRAEALRTDDYTASDIAWIDMKTNHLDFIVGPIENYEDHLFSYKAANEAYILVKDMAWSEKLEHYISFLPSLQESLPVDVAYKQESPGTSSQLNAYDVIYYAGDCNAGSKTIAVNLPNDETIQTTKGTRRSQLKNAMQAKFDKILIPIATELIVEDQRSMITFNAFFNNTMFHEVAHGLGIKNTINGKGTVREALKDQFSALEEGKADILGLYMITKLFEQGEITEGTLEEHYVTFIASIFRSVRFGASSAHGKANMVRFNYFKEQGAFVREESGMYRVDMERMRDAMTSLSATIITLQGDGDYEGVSKLFEEKGNIGRKLQVDLDRLSDKGIPVDVVFEQGVEALGL